MENKYFILVEDTSEEADDAILYGENDFLSKGGFSFDQGVSYDFEQDIIKINLYIYSDRGRMTDNLFLEGLNFVISDNTKKTLEDLNNDNIQYFNLQIIDEFSNNEEFEIAKYQDEELEYETKIYSNYHIANILKLIDCVNHETSELEYYDPRIIIPENMPENMKAILLQQEPDNDIDFIRHLVLDESKIPEDLKIFRLKDCPRILVFKEEIVNAIREAKLTGFVFIPLSEYTDEIPDDDDDDEIEENEKTKKEKTKSKTVSDKKETKKPIEEEEPEAPKTKGKIVIKNIRKH